MLCAARPSSPSQFAGTPRNTRVSGRRPGISRPKAASRSRPLPLAIFVSVGCFPSTVVDVCGSSVASHPSPSLSSADSDTSWGEYHQGRSALIAKIKKKVEQKARRGRLAFRFGDECVGG